MISVILTIVNPLGLHARPAAKLVECASRFSSSVKIDYQGQEIDAKSIMSVMMLAAPMGAELSLHVDGRDELEATEALQSLVSSGFGEME